MDPQVFTKIELDQLMDRVRQYKEHGWRLANLCASTVGDKVELLYSFSAAEELENLYVLVANGQPVPAVSKLYTNAFFFENEARDLYGVEFKDNLLDYGGRFYSPSIPTPLNPSSREARQYLEDTDTAQDEDKDDTSAPAPTSDVAEAPPAGAGEVTVHG